MPSYTQQVHDSLKKSPGFFTPYTSKTDPLKAGAATLVLAPVGGLLAVFGFIGTAGNAVNTAGNVAFCGHPIEPAKRTVDCFTLALLGIAIAAVGPVWGVASIVTRSGATIVNKIRSKDSSINATATQDAAVAQTTAPADVVVVDNNHQDSHQESEVVASQLAESELQESNDASNEMRTSL